MTYDEMLRDVRSVVAGSEAERAREDLFEALRATGNAMVRRIEVQREVDTSLWHLGHVLDAASRHEAVRHGALYEQAAKILARLRRR